MTITKYIDTLYKTRVLPSVLECIKRRDDLPKKLLFSLASLIVFYQGNRNGEAIKLTDSHEVLSFFKEQWANENIASVVNATLENINFWGADLTQYDGLLKTVTTK